MPASFAETVLDDGEVLLRGIGAFERDGTDVDAVDGGGGRKAGGEVMHYFPMCHSQIRERHGVVRQAREPCDHRPEIRARCLWRR